MIVIQCGSEKKMDTNTKQEFGEIAQNIAPYGIIMAVFTLPIKMNVGSATTAWIFGKP